MSDNNHITRSNRTRREFISATSGAIAVTALGLEGCVHVSRQGTETSQSSDPDLLARLVQLDDVLEELNDQNFIRSMTLDRWYRGNSSPDLFVDDFVTRADELSRRSLRTLMLSAVVLNLPEESQGSTEVRERIERLGPEMDESIAENLVLLRSCPTQEVQEIGIVLRESPDLVMEICEELDRWGSSRGLGRFGRRSLRSAGRRLRNGLRSRPLTEVIDEYVGTAEAVIEEQGVTLSTFLSHSGGVGNIWRTENAKEQSPEFRRGRRRQRSGNALIIAGQVTAPICGIGLFLLIAGYAVVNGATRRMRQEALRQSRASR